MILSVDPAKCSGFAIFDTETMRFAEAGLVRPYCTADGMKRGEGKLGKWSALVIEPRFRDRDDPFSHVNVNATQDDAWQVVLWTFVEGVQSALVYEAANPGGKGYGTSIDLQNTRADLRARAAYYGRIPPDQHYGYPCGEWRSGLKMKLGKGSRSLTKTQRAKAWKRLAVERAAFIGRHGYGKLKPQGAWMEGLPDDAAEAVCLCVFHLVKTGRV